MQCKKLVRKQFIILRYAFKVAFYEKEKMHIGYIQNSISCISIRILL